MPNILELKKTTALWAKPSDLPGIHVDLQEQVDQLKKYCLPYQKEYLGNKTYAEGVKNHFGLGYGYIEAQAIHGVVRSVKPKKIIEIGSGVSTYCMLKACELNDQETGLKTQITCIEPYPSAALKALTSVKLIAQKAQTVPLEVFTQLEENDLIFIDSSHVVKPGSDVNYLFLEVLPRLKKGVLVHVHDIYLPYDYQRNTLESYFHWNENSLLRAFLTFNSRTQIVFCMSHLHYARKDILKEVFPDYVSQVDWKGMRDPQLKPFETPPGHFPSSLYFKFIS